MHHYCTRQSQTTLPDARRKRVEMIVTKMQITHIPAQYQKEEGYVAFQKVELNYSFYGKQMVEIFDTKILNSGKQVIINGNGFIKDGFEIN